MKLNRVSFLTTILFSLFLLISVSPSNSCYGQNKTTISTKELTKVTRGLIGLGLLEMAQKTANKALGDNPSLEKDPDFLCIVATIYNHKKEFSTSSGLLKMAADLCTSTACLNNVRTVAAEAQYLSKDYNGTISALSDYLKESPEDPNPWYYSGASKFLTNQFGEAIPDLENAYNRRSNDSLFLWESYCLEMLAQSSIHEKKYDISEKYLNILLGSEEKDSVKISWYYHMLGSVYSDQVKYDEAIQKLEKAISLYPSNIEAYEDLSKVYISKGNKAKADEIMNNLIKTQPANPEAYFQLGMYMLNNNNPVGASANMDKAIALDPTNSKYSAAASMAYGERKEFNKAIQYCMKAVMIDPTNEWSNYYLGYLYAQNKQWDQTIEWENKALAINAMYSLANSVMAWAYLEKNQCDKVMEYAQKSIQSSQNDNGAFDMPYYYKGVCLEKAGETDRAIGFYRVAAAIGNPESQAKLKQLGKTWGTWDLPAQEYYVKASEQSTAENFTDALKFIDLAYELAPNKDLVLDFKIIIWIKQKDPVKALAAANEALLVLPQNDRINNTTGYLYYLMGEKDNCFKHLAIASSMGNETAINYLYTIGNQFYKVDDYAYTAKFLAEAGKYMNLSDKALYLIGYCYHMSNDLTTATEFYKKAAALGNESAQSLLRDAGISW